MKILVDIPEDVYKRLTDIRKPITLSDSEVACFAVYKGSVIPQCNQCKYYEGVHNCQGHAPCSYHAIGGVMSDWYCSQFERYEREQK